MRKTTDIMGMHVTADIRDNVSEQKIIDGITLVFDYLKYVDQTFSTYKEDSEISRINRNEIPVNEYSSDMQEIFRLAELTRQETNGYFDIKKASGSIDPSGVVKGWAIWKAGLLLEKNDFHYFFVDVGGDIQAMAPKDEKWKVGIRNPFNLTEIVKVVEIRNEGVATSGTYERGSHIYNPHDHSEQLNEILSITVIGPNIYEADRFATAAFAMGSKGIDYIESKPDLEGYMIDNKGIATQTSGFHKFISNN